MQLIECTQTFVEKGLSGKTTHRASNGYVLDVESDAATAQYPWRDVATGKVTPPEGPMTLAANTSQDFATIDNPGLQLTKACATESEDAIYRICLMYQPDGGIWVTLQMIVWDWAGKAENPIKLTPAWELAPGSTPRDPSQKLPGIKSYYLPEWKDEWPNIPRK